MPSERIGINGMGQDEAILRLIETPRFALGAVDKFEAVFHCGDIEHGEETFGEFVISCRDGAVDLEVAEHALDAVALPVEAFVPPDRGLAVGFRRNDRPNAASLVPRSPSKSVARYEIGYAGQGIAAFMRLTL